VVEVALTWAIYLVMSPSYKFFFPLKNPPFVKVIAKPSRGMLMRKYD
jgi:hypothetical protein